MLKQLQHKVPPPVWGILFGISMWWLAGEFPIYTVEFSFRQPLYCLIGGIGLSIDLYSIYLFLRAKTTVNPFKPSASTLVTSGMYRFSRNPMYLGMLLILCACTLYFATLSAVLLLPLFIVVLNKSQIEPEEAVLNVIFPEHYPQYCSQVRRWL